MSQEVVMMTLSWCDVEVVGVVRAGIGRASATNAAQSIHDLQAQRDWDIIKWRCTKDEEQGLESEGCMGISIGRFAIGHMP